MSNRLPRHVRVGAVSIVLGLLSCDSSTGPAFPVNEVHPFDAPPKYALWWSLVEECAGRNGDLRNVNFYRSKSSTFVVDNHDYAGYWWSSGNRIAVADPNQGSTVRHEMLHALLQRGDHPPEYFAGACDGVVSFNDQGVYGLPSDAEAAATVGGDSVLQVSIATLPSAPRLSDHVGAFVYVVTAANIADRPYWITIPNELLATFYVRERGYGSATTTTRARVFFAAHQQRWVLIDAGVDSVGLVHVQGAYAGVRSRWTPITLSP